MSRSSILSELLNCWYLDVDYLENLIETYDIELDIDEIRRDFGKVNMNILIGRCFENMKDRFLKDKKGEIEKIAEESINDFEEYETFTNCLDSHLWFKNEEVESLFQLWKSENDFSRT